MSLLETDSLRKSFQGISALDQLDISIESGELVGIVGPNGAGKTTLFNCLTGVLKPDAGTIRFRGNRIDGLDTAEIAQRGLIRTFQMPHELAELTVAENVKLGARDHPGETARHCLFRTSPARQRESQVIQTADEIVEFLDLDHLKHDYSRSLSAGQRKLLELGRVLMADPAVMLLDEPFAGVNPTLERHIVDRIVELNDQGQTIVVIEHDVETLVEMSERLIVLHNGRVLADGPPAAVLDQETVIDAYLGQSL